MPPRHKKPAMRREHLPKVKGVLKNIETCIERIIFDARNYRISFFSEKITIDRAETLAERLRFPNPIISFLLPEAFIILGSVVARPKSGQPLRFPDGFSPADVRASKVNIVRTWLREVNKLEDDRPKENQPGNSQLKGEWIGCHCRFDLRSIKVILNKVANICKAESSAEQEEICQLLFDNFECSLVRGLDAVTADSRSVTADSRSVAEDSRSVAEDCRSVADIVWNFAKLGLQWGNPAGGKFLAALLAASKRLVLHFDAQDTANILLSFAKTGVQWKVEDVAKDLLGDDFRAALLEAVFKAVDPEDSEDPNARFNGHQVADVHWALGEMKFQWESLGLASERVLLAAISRLVSTFNAQDLTNVFLGLAEMGCRRGNLAPNFRGVLWAAVRRLFPNFNPRELSRIPSVLAKLGVQRRDLYPDFQRDLSAAIDRLRRMGPDFSPREVDRMLLALATMGFQWESLGSDSQRALLAAVNSLVPKPNGQNIANLFLAFAKLHVRWEDHLDPASRRDLLEKVNNLPSGLSEQIYTNIAWSFAILDSRCRKPQPALAACARRFLQMFDQSAQALSSEEGLGQCAVAYYYFRKPSDSEQAIIKNFRRKRPEHFAYHKQVQRRLIERVKAVNPEYSLEAGYCVCCLSFDMAIFDHQHRLVCAVDVHGFCHSSVGDAAKEAIFKKLYPEASLYYIKLNWVNFGAVVRAINGTEQLAQPRSSDEACRYEKILRRIKSDINDVIREVDANRIDLSDSIPIYDRAKCLVEHFEYLEHLKGLGHLEHLNFEAVYAIAEGLVVLAGVVKRRFSPDFCVKSINTAIAWLNGLEDNWLEGDYDDHSYLLEVLSTIIIKAACFCRPSLPSLSSEQERMRQLLLRKFRLQLVRLFSAGDAFDADGRPVASVAWGFYRLGSRYENLDHDFLLALLRAACTQVPCCDARSLASMASALATMGFPAADLRAFQRVLPAAVTRLASEFSDRDTVAILLALAKLRIPWERLGPDARQALLKKAGNLPPGRLSEQGFIACTNSVWSFMLLHSGCQKSQPALALDACARALLPRVRQIFDQALPFEEALLTKEALNQYAMAHYYFGRPGDPESLFIKNFRPKRPVSSEYHKRRQRHITKEVQAVNPAYSSEEEYCVGNVEFVDGIILDAQGELVCMFEINGPGHDSTNDAAKEAIIKKLHPGVPLYWIGEGEKSFKAAVKEIRRLIVPAQPQPAPLSHAEVLDSPLLSSPVAPAEAVSDLPKKTKKKKRKSKNCASAPELPELLAPTAAQTVPDDLHEKTGKRESDFATGAVEADSSPNPFLAMVLFLVGGLATLEENTNAQTVFGFLTILCLICQVMHLAGVPESDSRSKSVADLTHHAGLAQRSSGFFASTAVEEETETVSTPAAAQLTV